MIIVSAHKEGLTEEENARRSAKLVEMLVSIISYDGMIIPVQGAYNNVIKQCYIVRMHPECVFDRSELMSTKLLEGAKLFNQDSIGFINLECDPPRMGVIDCKTRQTTSFGVARSRNAPPKGVADNWVKMQEHYFFPYGELTVLDDLSKFQVVELEDGADKPVRITDADTLSSEQYDETCESCCLCLHEPNSHDCKASGECPDH